MMRRAFRSVSICMCFCPVVVHAWNDMLPKVQFFKPKQVEGLLKPPAPIFEILKRPPPFGELKGPILEHLGRAKACCKAMTAQCIACSKGMRTQDLCRQIPRLPGCSGHMNGPHHVPAIEMSPPGIPAMATPDMPSLPLKDMLKEAVMAAEGKSDAARLVEDVEQYVDKHPGALESATNKALEGLSKMFSHSHSDQKKRSTALEDYLPAIDGSVTIPVTPEVVDQPASGRRWVESPWVITGITTATAAVCMGISMGVLCFARIQRVRMAREPLLAGGPVPSSLSEATLIV